MLWASASVASWLLWVQSCLLYTSGENKEELTAKQSENIHQMFKLVDEALTQMNYMFAHERHSISLNHTCLLYTSIPNREVKLTCADGTAMQCGRVGSRLLLSRASEFERFLRLFCFSYSSAFLSQIYPTDYAAPFIFLPIRSWIL